LPSYGLAIPGSGLLLMTWQNPTLGFWKQERQLRTGLSGGCLRSIAQRTRSGARSYWIGVTVNLQFTWSKAAELIDQTVSTLTLNWISENVAAALVKNLVWIQGLYCTPFLYGYSRGILDPRRSFRLHSETFKVRISFVCWTSYQCNITEMAYCWDIVTIIKRLTGCGLSVIWHHFI